MKVLLSTKTQLIVKAVSGAGREGWLSMAPCQRCLENVKIENEAQREVSCEQKKGETHMKIRTKKSMCGSVLSVCSDFKLGVRR